MKILNKLEIEEGKILEFGMPDTKEELKEMFALRYRVYSERRYFNSKVVISNDLDIDKYDTDNKCIYFIVKINNKIIGTVRMIRDDFLPTEKECFRFDEPVEIKKIPRNERREIGRLIIIPPNNNEFLPRNLVLIFLIKCIVDFSLDNNIAGGYSFVTRKLLKKLKRIKFPIYIIKKYDQIYPENGLLYPYFHQRNNPIIPIFYFTNEIEKYFKKILDKKIFRQINRSEFILELTIYVKFLKMFGVI